MEVYFRDRDLFEAVSNQKVLTRKYGQLRGKLILRRIQTLKSATSLDQLKGVPGRFHELSGDRKGQWACDLDQPFRMVFELEEKAGHPIAIIIEIVDYHGK